MLDLMDLMDLCDERGVKLIYATKFGSRLYGTDTPDSDTDYKVIFLPKKEDLLVCDVVTQFSHKTGSDKSKNTKDDVDVEFKSIHQFLHELGKGNAWALDVAYSFTNEDCVLYKDECMNAFFENVHKFYDVTNLRGYIGYAQSQAMKYSTKGERLFVLEKAIKWLEEHTEYKSSRVLGFAHHFLLDCSQDTFCCLVTKDVASYIHILGTDYMLTSDYGYFLSSLREKRDKYCERSRKVAEAFEEGKPSADWKALSHALRCTFQVIELLNYGKITFPLVTAHTIKKVKNGDYSFKDVSEWLTSNIELVYTKLTSEEIKNTMDEAFKRAFILSLYGGW